MFIFLAFATENEKSKFEYIYNKYKKLLLFKASEILKDSSLAEDAVSDAFIRIYKNMHKIDDLDSGRTISFLVTIVKNVSITLLTKTRKAAAEDYEEFDIADTFNLEETALSAAAAEDMLKLVDQLSENIKAPFLLKYAHDLSHKEISKILNISENNVTVRIHRAKSKLAQLLKEGGYLYEGK